MSLGWLGSVPDAAQPSAAVVAAVLCTYLILIVLVAMVASLHPDADRREDARKVLDLLLRAGRGHRRR